MPGGFHPFHAGHAALYQSAVKAFPDAEVYVAASNDTKTRPFPFSIKEKLAKLAGVAPGHFVQVKSPFQSQEITSHYNPDEDVLIFVRSEKDKNESPKPGGTKKDGSPSYYQPWTGKDLQPFSKHAYMAYLPTVEFGPGIKSATEIRNAWPNLNEKRKLAMVMSLYPATQKNPKLAANVVKMLDMGMGEQQGVAEGAEQQLTVQQLATISDEALDKAYGYGRSTPGNSFGWQANLMSAAYAKKMIDAGVTDIEKISDAIHKGWNVTAQKFVQNPDQFGDTEKLRQAGKLEAKLAQRAKLMKINYAQLDNEEQEKDRVVARALLQTIKGQQGVAEGEGNFAGDTPVNLGGVTVKRLGIGDIVTYLGQRAKIVDMSRDKTISRITIEKGMGGVTQNVRTSDLKRTGMAEADNAGAGFGPGYPGTYEQENGPFTHKGGHRTTSLTTESVDYLDEK